MWRITLLTVVCLCAVEAGSTTKPVSSATASTTKKTTTPKPSMTTIRAAPPAGVSTSTKGSPAATQKVGGGLGATTPKPAPPAATQPQEYECKVFKCIGETCYNFKNTTNFPCKGSFCMITAFKSGNQISLGGSCASACTDKRDGNNKTHCCQATSCNTNEDEVAKAVDFSGAVFWTINLLFLFIMQAMAFALNV